VTASKSKRKIWEDEVFKLEQGIKGLEESLLMMRKYLEVAKGERSKYPKPEVKNSGSG